MKKEVSFLLMCIFCLMFVACNSDEHIGEAKTPSGSSAMKGRDHESVVEAFEEKGFTNIKLETIDDLITGWLTKEGEVEKVTVGGDEKYSPNKWIPADTEIIIYYHIFPNNEGNDNTEAEKTDSESIEEPSGFELDKNVEKILKKTYKVGNTITFGVYNRWADGSGDNKEIEWEVIAVDEESNKILIRTKDIIDGKPYSLTEEETVWEDSYLRSWLNNDFYNNQFTDSERYIIADTLFIYGEEQITDKIFLPSYDEAYNLNAETSYRAKATSYAFSQGVKLYNSYKIDHPVRTERNIYKFDSDDPYTSRYRSENSYCDWWLRPTELGVVEIINGWGEHEVMDIEEYDNLYGVRPALWLDLSVNY